MKSTLGVLKAFEFLEEVLLKSPSVDLMEEHLQDDIERRKRKARFRRQSENDQDEDEEDYAADFLEAQSETPEDRRSRIENNWHISLFGEIAHDEDFTADLVPPSFNLPETFEDNPVIDFNDTAYKVSHRNVSELLFHPANFKTAEENKMEEDDMAKVKMDTDHFTEMMFDIRRIYRSISEKLAFWKNLSKSGVRRPRSRHRSKVDVEEESLLNKDLEEFQCDVSTNSEICHLVADFFQVLSTNEGPDFHLFFDDLPIYYVPAQYKDKLYLMANLFTK